LPKLSFANTVVFNEFRTRIGTGRYCNAVNAMSVVVGAEEKFKDIA